MASPPLKRSLEEPISVNAVDLAAQSGETPDAVRADSPLSSVNSVVERPESFGPNTSAIINGQTPPAKKRKLTPAEKEAVRVEKERAQQEKVAQKAQREQERQAKLEEKKAKDEEKEEKRRVREAEKAAKDQERKDKQEKKDAERRAKDEEKAKKERSQMRLTGFFGGPRPKAGSPASVASSRRGSVVSIEDTDEAERTPAKPQRNVMFLPFEPPSHSFVAPYNRYIRDGASSTYAVERIDTLMQSKPQEDLSTGNKRAWLDEAFQEPVKRRRYNGPHSVKTIITSMQGSQNEPIDLTSSRPTVDAPLETLKKVPVKQLKYKEDVRPPYVGTYTKVPHSRSIKSLSRKPIQRALPKMDYDYDSEAEWEEPEEGEDLVSEGEEDADEDGADEMDGFLDDEGTESDARRRPVADVPPLQTQIHWETAKRSPTSDTVNMGEGTVDLKAFRIETLLETPITAIDPHSTIYWHSTAQSSMQDNSADSMSNMAPPRLPLTSIPSAANIPPAAGTQPFTTPASPFDMSKVDANQASRWNTFPGTAVMNPGKSKAGRPPAQPFPAELLDNFKAAVLQDREMTKVGMLEILKRKFPSVSKVTLTETLERLAVRVGEKQAEKRWELKT